MIVYVTGGLGFIGSRVIEALGLSKPRIVCVDRRSKLESMTKSGLPICRRIMRAVSLCEDIVEPEAVRPINDALLIHLGAVVDTGKADADIFAQNVDYVRWLFPQFSRIVFASSGAVYGNHGHPDNVYGLTKSIAERMLTQSTGLTRAISLRFMNVYGNDEHHKGEMASMPFKMARAYDSGSKIKLFNTADRRDFVRVDDVASAVLQSAARVCDKMGSRFHEIYDVGTGTDVSFKELDAMVRFPDEPSQVEVIEIPRQLAGVYQRYTRAGMMTSGVTNIFDEPWCLAPRPIGLQMGAPALRGKG